MRRLLYLLLALPLPIVSAQTSVPSEADKGEFVRHAPTAPDAAAALEAALKASPDDRVLHLRLMGYYWSRSVFQKQPDARRGLVVQADWFAEHEPQSFVFDISNFSLQKTDFAAPYESDFALYKGHWKTAITLHPNDAAILTHAMIALASVDIQVPMLCHGQLRQLFPDSPIYAEAMASDFARLITVQLKTQPGPSSLVASVLKFRDPVVTGLAGQMLYAQERLDGKTDGVGVALLTRAHELDPSNKRWPAIVNAPAPANRAEALAAIDEITQQDLWIDGRVPAMPAVPGTLAVEPAQQAAKLVSPNPMFLKNALETRLGPGKVELSALIGQDGKVQQVRFNSGSVGHLGYALGMLKGWEYAPTLVDGKPVPVSTRIDLVFTAPSPSDLPPGGVMGGLGAGVLRGGAFGGTPQADPVLKTATPDTIKVSPGVLRALALPHASIPYPDAAKETKEIGYVDLKALISAKGEVQELGIISGPPHLRQSVMEAVKTWKYRPYMVDGKPREVQSTISVIFYGERVSAQEAP